MSKRRLRPFGADEPRHYRRILWEAQRAVIDWRKEIGPEMEYSRRDVALAILHGDFD